MYFLPLSDAGKLLWLNNFANKIGALASRYGISTAEVSDIVNSAAFYSGIVNYCNQVREQVQGITAYKNGMRDGEEDGAVPVLPAAPGYTPPIPANMPLPGIFFRMTTYGNRIKKHAAYTLADGSTLGLEGATLAGRGTDTPVLTLSRVMGNLVNVGWKKVKGTSAIEIHVNRGSGWNFLAIDSTPDYIDTETLPAGQTAVWKYRAIYRNNDERDGEWGTEYSITVTGI